MSLRSKLFLYIVGAVIIFALLYGIMYRLLIIPGATRQKNIFTSKMISRVEAAITSEKNRISIIVADWANWDSMTSYVLKPDRKLEQDMFTDNLLDDLDLDLLLILDIDGNVVRFSNTRTPDSPPAQFQALEERQGALWKSLIGDIRDRVIHTWLVATPDGPWILASSPVRKSDGKPPVFGRLLMAKKVDDKFSLYLSHALSENCQIDALCGLSAKNPPYDCLLRGCPYKREEKRDSLDIFTVVKDSFNRPAFCLRIALDNNPFYLLERAIELSFFILLGVTILSGILIFYSVHTSILKRIVDIVTETEKISFFKDLSVRVPEGCKDEMGNLARHINRMLERLEYEVRQSTKMKDLLVTNEKTAAIGRLASNIAHEVNNPLFAIANTLQVIKKNDSSKASHLEAITLAEQEIKRVRDIMSGLLDYSRLRKEDFLPTDIGKVIETALKVLNWSRQIDGIGIEWKVTDPVVVPCNADGLQQVFMNLVRNAAEAGGPGGTVGIHVHGSQQFAEISISDDGPGFSGIAREHLFEPYNTDKKREGSGLGLFVSHQIVQQHAGEILLGEDEFGRNCVTVRIPLRKESS